MYAGSVTVSFDLYHIDKNIFRLNVSRNINIFSFVRVLLASSIYFHCINGSEGSKR